MLYTALRRSLRRYFASREGKTLLCALAGAFLFGLAAHAYGFLHSGFSHDSLNALYAGATENLCKTANGRFLVPVYRVLTRGALALPWLIGLLALLYIGLGAYLVCRIFAVDSLPAAFLAGGILAVNPTVASLTGTYIHELDADMLAMLLAVLAARSWRRDKGAASLCGAALLTLLSCGIYQSYISTAAGVMLFASVLDLVHGEKCRDVLRRGIWGIVSLGVGFGLYILLSRLACALCSLDMAQRVRLGAAHPSAAYAYLQTLGFLLQYNGVSGKLFFPVLSALAYAAAGIIALVRIGKGEGKRLLAALLFLLAPLALNTAGFVSEETHYAMLFALWLVPVFALAVFSEELRKTDKRSAFAALAALSALLVLFCLHDIRLANEAYLKKDLQTQAELSQMTRVLGELEAREDYTMGETELVFVGAGPIGRDMEGFDDCRVLTGLYTTGMLPVDTPTWYYDAYDAYFRFILHYPVRTASPETRAAILDELDLAAIPTFPEKGYIVNTGGALLVHLS